MNKEKSEQGLPHFGPMRGQCIQKGAPSTSRRWAILFDAEFTLRNWDADKLSLRLYQAIIGDFMEFKTS